MNFIVIMTDGMRADFAHSSHLMPQLYAFLKEHGGYKFTNAYTTTTWTVAALMSLYTGRLPSNNGVDDITYSTPEQAMKTNPKYWKADKCQDTDFLMVKLKELSYHTTLFTVGRLAKSLAQTANHHFDKQVLWDYRYFQLSKLENQVPKASFFFHIYDQDGGHDPFGRYPRTTLEEWTRWKNSHQAITYLYLWKNKATWSRNRLYACCHEQAKQYDEKLGAFFRWLVKTGLHKTTTVIFTSDHGSCLWDHNWIGHVQNCYEEIVRVPLIVYTPNVEVLQIIPDIVSITDIAPTVLGVDRFGDGVNLFKREKDRAVFFEFKREKDPAGNKMKALADPRYPKTLYVRGLRHQNFKFIVKKTVMGKETSEFYDLADGHVEDELSRSDDEDGMKKYLTMLKETFHGQKF